MSLIFFGTDFLHFLFFRKTKGVFINHVDGFLDILGPQFSHYRIEVALIKEIAHCAGAGFRKICYNFSILYKLRCYQDTGHVLALIVVVQCQNTITYL